MGPRFSMLIFLFLLVGFCSFSPAQIHISGPLSGTLVDTTYIVDGDIFVEDSASLIIEAGADFFFDGHYMFEISGYLIAVGTESDSITFQPFHPDSSWRGIDFMFAVSEFCVMEYCLIAGSMNKGITIGGCNPTIRHCTVTGNSGTYWGGGIFVRYSANPTISNCTITENSSYHGAGIGIFFAQATISNCIITRNQSSDEGAGINVEGGSYTTIDHCLIAENVTTFWGGGLNICSGANVSISNCTIVSNSCVQPHGGGISNSSGSSLQIVNTIVANNIGGGIRFSDDQDDLFTYGCFYNNQGGNILGSGAPDSLGVIVTTNVNGDSCDIYQNIFLDPMFVDTANGDYHLMAGSPCIDAGDPESPLDPDSTIADIGAFYFDQSSWVFPKDRLALPTEFRLLQNYPNPFNATTTLRYAVPSSSLVRLTIHNIMGQKVATLVDGYQDAGYHSINWNGTNLASGVYIYQLQSGGHTLTQKMVLLK